jgi:hypothetical protein
MEGEEADKGDPSNYWVMGTSETSIGGNTATYLVLKIGIRFFTAAL